MKKLSNITTILAAVNRFITRYTVMILFVVLSVMYGFLAYRINVLTQAEPSDEAVVEKLNTVPRSKIDQTAIDKMRQLENENIEVKTLFEEARNNPFSE